MNGIQDQQKLESVRNAKVPIGIGKRTGKRIDITGQRFGRLVVMAYAKTIGTRRHRVAMWQCRCICGNETEVRGNDLRAGKTQSCGCLGIEKARASRYKHGKKGTVIYKTWQDMKARCQNEHTKCYDAYGGRGIKVCERWQKFENFFEDMGKKPRGLTLERINNDGNYEPENCRWATRAEQNRNTRFSRNITYQNKRQCLKDWAVELGVNYNTLYYRINKYPPEIAFNMTKYTNSEAL